MSESKGRLIEERLVYMCGTFNKITHEIFVCYFCKSIIVKYGILQNFHLLLAIVLNKLYNIAIGSNETKDKGGKKICKGFL